MLRNLVCLLLLAGFATAAQAQVATEQSGMVVTVPGLSSTVFAVPARTMRDIPFETVLRQRYDYSCGSAALATLLRYHYGLDVDEAKVFEAMFTVGDQAAIHKVGFSLLDMKKYLKTIGIDSNGYRMSLDELAAQNAPAITVITVGAYKHFAVVKGVNAREVLLGDPALGLRRIPREEFLKMWTGIVFMLNAPSLKAPVFNAANEWRPFTQAPLGAQIDEGAMASLTVSIPTIFQITQFTPINAP